MDGGGMETCDPKSTNSGDGVSLWGRTAIEEVSTFSFCDSGDRSSSLRFRKALIGVVQIADILSAVHVMMLISSDGRVL
jgi:hypothetical protein